MDRELPDADRARIRAIAEAHPEVSAVYEIRTRASGPTSFIQFHVEMDPGMTLAHAHEVSDAIEASILKAFPSAEVIIHRPVSWRGACHMPLTNSWIAWAVCCGALR